MWKAYKYVYYWLYTWQKKLWGENDLPQYNVILGLSLSLVCNIMTINILIYIIADIMIIPTDLPKIKVLSVAFIVLLIHYLLFVHKGKYQKIEKEFKGESKTERRRKGRWVLLYALGSIFLVVIITFFGIWVKHG